MPIEFGEPYWNKCWAHQRGVKDDIRCAILAAGLGSRMEPFTVRYIPKPLFPLGGKMPMVETWIRRMVDSGIMDLSMNLCVLKDTIKDYFEDGGKFGARISYVEEEIPSGTLGGVCKQVFARDAKVLPGEQPLVAEPFTGSTVIVPSGDIVTNFGADQLHELYDIHKSVGAALTMVLVPIPWERRKDFGTAVLDGEQHHEGTLSKSGRIVEFREKDPESPSNLNNASIYLIESRLLKKLDPLRTPASLDAERPFYDFGKHVFAALLDKLDYAQLSKDHLLYGVQYDGAWHDVGRKRDYLRVNEELLDGSLDLTLPYERLPWGYLGRDVAIDFSRVSIIPPVVIGNHCTVEPGVTLGPYAVIGDGWTIERGAQIRHSVLWERYQMHGTSGPEMSESKRRLIDRHEVRQGVTIEESIVAGGMLEQDIRECTVALSDDGKLAIAPIDSGPSRERA